MTRAQGSKWKETRVGRVRRLTAGLLHHCAPAWSPDGHLLCFALGDGTDSHWLLTDRKGRAARVLAGPVVGCASMAPDHSVAYGRQVGATAEIWLLPATAAQPQRLLGGDGRLYRDPAFSPDGRHLAYAADDGSGEDGASLRLWIVELSRLEHKLLVSELPTLAGATGPARIGHLAWSPAGDFIFFELTQGEQSAIALVCVQSQKAQLLTGPGFRKPAPLSSSLLCLERVHKDGRTQVCLLQFRMPRSADERGAAAGPATAGKLRTVALAGIVEGAREPAVAVGNRGVVHLAFVAPGRNKGGESPRYDIHVGRIVGLPALRVARAQAAPAGEGPPAEEAPPEADAGALLRQAAAAAAGLSAHAYASSQAVLNGDEAPADAERGV
jgi:hypothetical protein